jgi:hypothetical protein
LSILARSRRFLEALSAWTADSDELALWRIVQNDAAPAATLREPHLARNRTHPVHKAVLAQLRRRCHPSSSTRKSSREPTGKTLENGLAVPRALSSLVMNSNCQCGQHKF